MPSRFQVIVVGVGAMGAAACWRLAECGVAVLGLEQFDIPHGLGSSGGFTRLVRQAYFESSEYVVLLKRAYELWRELERVSGQELLTLNGAVYLGPRGHEHLAATLRAAAEHALVVEQLDAAALGERFPQFEMGEEFDALFEPNAGFVRSERAIAAATLAALERGAEIHARETVVEWREAARSGAPAVRVTTNRDVYEAERVIFCAGAWTGRLLADLGVPLVVTRQTVGWTWPRRPELFGLDRFPCWALMRPDGGLHYGLPLLPDNPGLKTAYHHPGLPVDPDQVPRGELPGDEAAVRWPLARYLPTANGSLLGLRTCLYANSPDGHFILGRHPRHPAAILACGFSGHGFKFMPVIGEILAELAVNGASSLSIEFLRLGRFGASD